MQGDFKLPTKMDKYNNYGLYLIVGVYLERCQGLEKLHRIGEIILHKYDLT